jgi:acetoin utilization deacetylase AcuC-like enzyme
MSASHVESPARISRIKHIIENSEAGRASIKLKARPATKEEIAWVHDKDYIDSIEETSGKVVPLDPDTTACPVTWDAACMAAGGVIEATKAVLDHKVDNAFAFVRPPGHHAETARAMGFCFFNNIAIAAEYAIRKYGLKRVVIVDFDIHHGNGTQHSFYNRSDVFYISTHRWPFYPGSGSRAEHGEGEGVGYTLNVPFETGDDAELKDIYKRVIIPVIDEYEPELILVSAGYDAHNADPLGGLSLSTEAFDWLTGELKAAAERSCNGKIVMILEGGYNVEALAECAEGALKTLQTS